MALLWLVWTTLWSLVNYANAAYVSTACLNDPAQMCFRDESLLSLKNYDELNALGQFFWACNGIHWENARNWCAGDDVTARGLRNACGGPCNAQCIKGVITDPCTGALIQYPDNAEGVALLGTYTAPAPWQEVSCSTLVSHQGVTSLDFLFNLNVTCDLDQDVPSLKDLEYLRYLRIKGNGLRGNVPASIGNMASLYTLDLSANSLDGTVPDSVGSALSMTSLILADNSLHGLLPESIGDLQFLNSLDVSGNSLAGTIPAGIGTMASLTVLTLNKNIFTGQLPNLNGLNSLTELRVHRNRFTGTIPTDGTFLAGSKAILERLFLYDNRFSGSLPPALKTDFPALTRFRAEKCNFTGLVPPFSATTTTIRLGPGNFFGCPFPSEQTTKLTDALANVECTCYPGAACTEGVGSCETSCSACEAGTFSTQVNVASCNNCSTGKATDVTVSAGGFGTAVGTVVPGLSGVGVSRCGDCAPGYANPRVGKGTCSSCSQGSFTASNGSTVCDACSRGKFSGPAATSCEVCPNGTIIKTGASACTPCPAGTSALNSTHCAPCGPGTFAASNGSDMCQACEAGTFEAGYGAVQCSSCEPGTASSEDGRTIPCEDCEVGRFSASEGLEECDVCDFIAGLAQNETGKASCEYCPDGSYAGDGTNCTLCPLGRAGPGDTSTRSGSSYGGVMKSVFQCRACDAGRFSDHLGAGNSDCSCTEGCYSPPICNAKGCAFCGPGYYSLGSPSPAYAAGHESCTPCSPGKRWVSSSAECADCAAGKFSDQDAETDCTGCPTGRYQPFTGRTSCESCETGKFASSTGTISACTPCPAGTYADSTGLGNCLGCPVAGGFYQPSTGQTLCLTAPAGFYRSSTTAVTPCPASTYSTGGASGISDCTDCASGKYSGGSASACVDCSAGRYASGAGNSACDACGLGTYSASGAVSCTGCGGGRYGAESGQTACEGCGAGRYQGAAGQSSCVSCAAGKFSSSTGAAACPLCPQGTYQAQTGSVSCTSCPGGTYGFSAGALSSNTCLTCGVGRYSLDASPECIGCKAGTFSAKTGATNCSMCGTGYFTDSEASTECVECGGGSVPLANHSACKVCSPGHFSVFPHTSGACVACDAETYQPRVQQVGCLSCSALTAESGAEIDARKANGNDDGGDPLVYGTVGLTGQAECVVTSGGRFEAEDDDGCSEFGGVGIACSKTAQASVGYASIVALALFIASLFGCCYSSAKKRFYAKYEASGENADESALLARSRAGRYVVTSRVLEVHEGPGKHEPRLTALHKGNEIEVVAAKGDWLLLADDGGWVLAFDKVLGARVSQLVDDYEGSADSSFASELDEKDPFEALLKSKRGNAQGNADNQSSSGSPVSGASNGLLRHQSSGRSMRKYRSSVYGISAGNPVLDRQASSSRGAPADADTTKSLLRSASSFGMSGSSAGKDGQPTKGRASRFGLPQPASKALGYLYAKGQDRIARSVLRDVARTNEGMSGDAETAGRTYYYVDIDRDEAADVALEKATAKEKKAKAKAAAKKNGRSSAVSDGDDSSDEDNGSLASGGGILKTIFGGESGHGGAPPPPPSKVNPYSMIEVKRFLGSDGGRGEDEQLPPPRPAGQPPRVVSKALFENAGKRTYEVQYYKVAVRAGPSLRARTVGTRVKGDIVHAVDENRHWVKVKAKGQGQSGNSDEGDDAAEGWMLRYQKKFGPLLQLVEVEEWESYPDPEGSGREYYVNRATNETTWVHPSRRPKPPKPPATLPPGYAPVATNSPSATSPPEERAVESLEIAGMEIAGGGGYHEGFSGGLLPPGQTPHKNRAVPKSISFAQSPAQKEDTQDQVSPPLPPGPGDTPGGVAAVLTSEAQSAANSSVIDVDSSVNAAMNELGEMMGVMPPVPPSLGSTGGDTAAVLAAESTTGTAVLVPAASVWSTAVDEASGKTYYFNQDTAETSWDAPP